MFEEREEPGADIGTSTTGIDDDHRGLMFTVSAADHVTSTCRIRETLAAAARG